jgi:acetylglutamate kinase
MANTSSISANDNTSNSDHPIAQALSEALPYIDYLKGKMLVIKLGGSALEQQCSILQDIIWLHMLGVRPILVHGGGPYINEWLNKLNISPSFDNGLRVTDDSTLDIVRMVLLGQVNQRLVLMASQMGGRAIGLCGTDGNMLHAHQVNERLGMVGEIDGVDPTLIHTFIDQGYIPIVAPLAQGPDGPCLNINADPVAAQLACALHAEKLIFLSNVAGICGIDGSLIPQLDEQEAQRLIDVGVIHGGMIPKVVACCEALSAVPFVHIVDGGKSHILVQELLTDAGAGTMICRSLQSRAFQERNECQYSPSFARG